MSTAAVPASWKNPKPLTRALTTWATRSDTRYDDKARAAADDALAAIDATVAELAALRARLLREIDAYDRAGDEIYARPEAAIRGDLLPCDCGARLPWPSKGGPDVTCPSCGAVWEHDGVDLGGGAVLKSLGHAEEVERDDDTALSDALTHTEAEDLLLIEGYSHPEAVRILAAADELGLYTDDLVSVAIAGHPSGVRGYTIRAAEEPLAAPQLATAVHSSVGLVHDEPASPTPLRLVEDGDEPRVCPRHHHYTVGVIGEADRYSGFELEAAITALLTVGTAGGDRGQVVAEHGTGDSPSSYCAAESRRVERMAGNVIAAEARAAAAGS